MRSKGRRGRDWEDLPVRADINVTSLVDVAFTLLLIFIITAPILQGGLDVNLPEATTRPFTPEDDPFIVSITETSRYVVGETEYSSEDFFAALPALFEASGKSELVVRADTASQLGKMVRLQDFARQQLEAEVWLVARTPRGGGER